MSFFPPYRRLRGKEGLIAVEGIRLLISHYEKVSLWSILLSDSGQL